MGGEDKIPEGQHLTNSARDEQCFVIELFLTPSEKMNFSEWVEVVNDKSVINRLIDPIFKKLCVFVPERIAPNALTLTGILAVVQAWYFCVSYIEFAPRFCAGATILGVCIYWTMHGLDSKH